MATKSDLKLLPGGCPEAFCDQISEVVDTFELPSTDGPVGHV